MTKYCYLKVDTYTVEGDERKPRGWRKDGFRAGVSQAMASGEVVFHELGAVEDLEPRFFYPSWEFSQGFLALLNRLAADGWRVVDFTPADRTGLFSGGDYAGRRPWPFGDFLLVRES